MDEQHVQPQPAPPAPPGASLPQDVARVLGDDGTWRAEAARDGVPTAWIDAQRLPAVLRALSQQLPQPYEMLYDLTAIDERVRDGRAPGANGDFTAVYHLLSFERNADLRLKVAVGGEQPTLPSATAIWPNANWYEREVWDMFGIGFAGHPDLRRLLMPPTWNGHPLRKDHPARATELAPYQLPDERLEAEQQALRLRPEDWGLQRRAGEPELLLLNLGPHHPGTHGVLRVALQLDGERIVDAVPDIGYHHRAAEKMGERQSWHTYIPYTDRVDYLGGVLNNMPYVLAVEQLAGIEVPDRARLIRIMLCELFRVASHLVWYGTFAQDIGALSPVFYTFNDREHIFALIEAVTGARMHPGWFRIGGLAADLPGGWRELLQGLLVRLPRSLDEYETVIMRNPLLRARTIGVGACSRREAIAWGMTGPNLRACGFAWDWRRARPYGGYEQLEFEIPTAEGGDCYARAQVRVAEMRQSLRIVQQCAALIADEGPYLAEHPAVTPPRRARTMRDIETLITHFVGVSWGPVIPPGEAMAQTEGAKGSYAYYLVSDGNVQPYRVRIRSASFPHMQMLPLLVRDQTIADVIATLGSIDFVLADVDR